MPTRKQVEFVAKLGIAARRHMGLDDAAIREQVVKVATRAVIENTADEYERERCVSIVQQVVDAELGRG